VKAKATASQVVQPTAEGCSRWLPWQSVSRGIGPGRSSLPGLLAALLGLEGCAAVGPDPVAPQIPVPAAWETTLELPVVEGTAWWQGFKDPRLDALVAQALAANPDLVVASARLAEARALVIAERSDLYPIVDGLAEGNVISRSDPGRDLDVVGIGGTLAFTPDLTGRQRRRIEAAIGTLGARVADLADARRLLVASVVDQYIEFRRTHAQLKLLDRALALQRQTLAIVEARFTAGLAARMDVQRATADAARTSAQRGLLEIARTQARVTLAVLLGTHAGELEIKPPPQIEGDPPIYAAGPGAGLPAMVVRNRPDLRAAEARLLAAVAGIGVEVADLYPTLRLPGRISASTGSATALTGQLLGVLGAVLDLPLLDAGRRRAEVAAARARADAALAIYQRTLLTALNEVENALVAIRAAEDRRRELQGAVAASEQAYEQLAALNREGLATFIDILDGQRVLILSREAYVDSEAGLARAVVALHRATGAPTDSG